MSYDGGPPEALGLVGLAWFLLWSLVTGVLLAVRTPERVGGREPGTARSFA